MTKIIDNKYLDVLHADYSGASDSADFELVHYLFLLDDI